jgi:hypothetical protein
MNFIINSIDNKIFVDPSSKAYLELGTKSFPYKTMKLPLIELFNFLPIDSNPFTIYVKENTTDYIKDLFTNQIVLNAQNLTIT